jgi:hypothetical protein
LQYPVYGKWTGEEPKQNIAGAVVSYEQAVWFPSISLTTGYTIKNRFGFFLLLTKSIEQKWRVNQLMFLLELSQRYDKLYAQQPRGAVPAKMRRGSKDAHHELRRSYRPYAGDIETARRGDSGV